MYLLVLTALFCLGMAAIWYAAPRTMTGDYQVTASTPENGGTAAAARVNINTAGVSELDSLPGIGPVLAQRIVDWRTENGPFRSAEDAGKSAKLYHHGGDGMKILVVDDEKLLVKGMKFNLENEGYEVATAYDGASAVELAKKGDIDLIVMDVMMPGLSGSDACMQVREFSNVPIIMLTARSEDSDKLMGFACGADDYVTKPFNILELKARIRALLRRAAGNGQPGQARQRTPLLTVGDLSLDTEQRVAIRDGRTIDLTAKEYDLIELLMKNPRRVYSRESLMDLVWGYSYAGDYRTVDVHIRRLREKLEANPASPVHIMTKWGVGYYFTGEEQPTA